MSEAPPSVHAGALPAPAAIAPSGNWAVLVRQGRGLILVRLVDDGSTLPLGTLTSEADDIASLSISHDGRWLAAGWRGGEVWLWAVQANEPSAEDLGMTWRLVSRVPPPDPALPDGAARVAFSPTEATLALARGRRVQLLRLDAQAMLAAAASETTPSADADSIGALTHDKILFKVRRDGQALRFIVVGSDERIETTMSVPMPSPEEARSRLGPNPGPSVRIRLNVQQESKPFGVSSYLDAVAELRRALVPPGLNGVGWLKQTRRRLLLDIADDLQGYPWELLLMVGEDAPLPGYRRGALRLPPRRFDFAAAARAVDVLMVVGEAGAGALADDLTERLSGLPGLRLRQWRTDDRPAPYAVLDELVRQPWQALVLIGPASPDGQGLALADGAVLGPAEIRAMVQPPELVFVAQGVMPALGPALMQQGVRCCVAPAWAVADEPAHAFASEFWRVLAAGRSFLDAVVLARQYAATRHLDDWAWVAYTCQGDPAWQLLRQMPEQPASPEGDATGPLADLAQRLAEAVPDEQVVRITPPQGPALDISVQSARELAGAAADVSDVAGTGGSGGWFSRAAAGVLKVVGVEAADAAPSLADAARLLDARVQPGLYPLTTDPPPQPLHDQGARPLTALPTGEAPLLVLVHGLMSHTGASFGTLWDRHPPLVDALFKRYAGRVFGLEQATLGQDPLDAALQLVRAQPPGARLHLLTHDSGGLVAELLALAAQGAVPDPASLADPDGRLFKRLLELQRHADERRLRIERIVRVAGPMRGMLFDARRADLLLAAMSWGLQAAGGPSTAPLQALLSAAARDREALARLPGLAALQADGPLLRWLNQPREPLAGELRVVAGRSEGGGLLGRLGRLLVDQLFGADNDMVVPTASMFGGTPRRSPGLYLLDSGPEVNHFNYFRNEGTARAVADALLLDLPPQFGTITPDLSASEAR